MFNTKEDGRTMGRFSKRGRGRGFLKNNQTDQPTSLV